MSFLEAKNLCYTINGTTILDDINISIKAGELVGFIGPNGAGKSTLLKLLAGIDAYDAGEILLNNKDIKQTPSATRSKMMGYLAQNAKAHWPFPVEQVVSLGRLPHQGWWQNNSDDDLEKIECALKKTETLAYRNRIVTTLSGGEHTLVMLARIFATEPQLILADEPIAALDPYHQLHVMELLRDHCKDNHSGIVVMHDLNLAARYCDRIYLLNHGKLFASGTPEATLTEKNLSEVYGVISNITHDNNGINITTIKRNLAGHP